VRLLRYSECFIAPCFAVARMLCVFAGVFCVVSSFHCYQYLESGWPITNIILIYSTIRKDILKKRLFYTMRYFCI